MGLLLGNVGRRSGRRAPSYDVLTAWDYLISSDADWTTVFANSDATLAGKTIAIAPGTYTGKVLGYRDVDPPVRIGLSAPALPTIPWIDTFGSSGFQIEFPYSDPTRVWGAGQFQTGELLRFQASRSFLDSTNWTAFVWYKPATVTTNLYIVSEYLTDSASASRRIFGTSAASIAEGQFGFDTSAAWTTGSVTATADVWNLAARYHRVSTPQIFSGFNSTAFTTEGTPHTTACNGLIQLGFSSSFAGDIACVAFYNTTHTNMATLYTGGAGGIGINPQLLGSPLHIILFDVTTGRAIDVAGGAAITPTGTISVNSTTLPFDTAIPTPDLGYDYTIASDADWTTVFANSDATLSGKRIRVMAGSYTAKTLTSRAPASEVRVFAADTMNRPTFASITWTTSTNFVFENILGPITGVQAAQGTVRWTWTGARETGNYIDGPAYVVVPSGTLSLNEPTPAQSTEAGSVINGAMKNPLYGSAYAFDQRNAAYSGTGLASFPNTVTAGDIVVKAISQPFVTNPRAGQIQEYSALYIVAAAPGVNEFAPTPWGWSGRGTPAGNTVDVNAALAALPSYNMSAYYTPTTDNATKFDRYNPGLMAVSATSSSGYQAYCVNKFGNPTASHPNYGQYVAETMDERTLFLCSNASQSAKRASLIRMIQLGLWRFETINGSGVPTVGDGGHLQFGLIPMLYGLKFSGRTSDIPTIATTAKDNFYNQAFAFDAGLVARLVKHSSDTEPFTYRLRTISAISGNNITVNSNLGGDPFHVVFQNLICCKSDDTEIGTVTVGGSSLGASTYTVTLSSVAGLSVSDQIYFKSPYSITAGAYHWRLTGAFNTFNPSNVATYSEINKWAATALTARLISAYDSTMDSIEGYVWRANQANTPAGFDLPAQFPAGVPAVQSFWNAHAASLIPR
jgi:hypothetical protein